MDPKDTDYTQESQSEDGKKSDASSVASGLLSRMSSITIPAISLNDDQSRKSKVEEQAGSGFTGIHLSGAQVDRLIRVFSKYRSRKDQITKVLSEYAFTDDVVIPDLNDPEIEEQGANSHFVFKFKKTEDGIERVGAMHAKTPGSQDNLRNSTYVEPLTYKILQKFGCGPKEMSRMAPVDAMPEESLAVRQVAKTIALGLWTITEDLSNMDPRNINEKSRSFNTKHDSLVAEISNNIASDEAENLDRFYVVMVAELLGLSDTFSKPSNIGLLTMTDNNDHSIRKPYIIDFNYEKAKYGIDDLVKELQNIKGEKIISGLSGEDGREKSRTEPFVGYYAIKLNKEVIDSAIERIFGDDGGKAQNLILESFNEIKGRFNLVTEAEKEGSEPGAAFYESTVLSFNKFLSETVTRFNKFYEKYTGKTIENKLEFRPDFDLAISIENSNDTTPEGNNLSKVGNSGGSPAEPKQGGVLHLDENTLASDYNSLTEEQRDSATQESINGRSSVRSAGARSLVKDFAQIKITGDNESSSGSKKSR